MELDKILAMPLWTPLVQVVDPILEDNIVRRGTDALLYRLSSDTYLAITDCRIRGQELEESRNGPLVAGVLWASTEGAARRARFSEIEADEGVAADIPAWCLPEGVAPRFGDILRAVNKDIVTISSEFATYRIASDGKFICRNIATRAYHYYFRGRRRNDSEPPFAAMRKLVE